MARTLEEGFTLGCDPELFIKDKGGTLIYPDFLPGTKQEPYKVQGGAIQRDGMAAEINIDPARTYRDFESNITIVMLQLREYLPSGCEFVIEPSVRFSQEVFDAAPEVAKEVGCDPDFDAYTGKQNPLPDVSIDPLMKCAGGHIHFGWTEGMSLDDKEHFGHCVDLAKQCDWFLAGWALRIDKDKERRKLYGKAGAFRPKPYGMEYRTLSNAWLLNADRRLQVWNRCCDAIREMRRFNLPELRSKEDTDLLVEYINTGVKPENLTGIRYPLQTTDPAYAYEQFGPLED